MRHNAIVPEHFLSDYVVYGPCPSGKKPVMSVFMTGDEIHLMVDFKEWPRDLFAKHRINLIFLFREAVMGKEVDVTTLREGVSLCCDIPACLPYQKGPDDFSEKRDCTFYTYGACIPATRWSNKDRALPMNVLGILRGATRQRVNQVLKRDYENLYELLQSQPMLREILQDIYKNRDVTADEIVTRVMNPPVSNEEEEEGPDAILQSIPG